MDQTTGPDDPAGCALGLDLGEARIGVAVSDPERRLAVPVGTIHVGQPPGELKAVAALVAEHKATVIVVGHPRSMSGASGPKAQQAEAFAEALRGVAGVPVELQDERLSTVEAERSLREAGVKGQDRRRVVDRSAAAIVLQSYLDSHRYPR
ncbi:MAG TPA: Holliday junction resolvase RuvX [Actinomycetota bacterium]